MGWSRTGLRSSVWRAGVVATVLVAAVGCSEDSGEAEGGGGEGGEAAAAPFDGETIEFVVPYEPGGGYDVYARTIAPYLGECLGAEVVVLNEPGAGGLLATGKTAVADPDGLRIQILNMPGVVSSQIAEAEGVRYDLNEFSWVGRIAAPPEAVVVGADSDIEGFGDIIDATDTIRFVATGPGSSEYIAASVLSEAYGIPSEIVTGFAGSGEARNAVVAGNADALSLPFDSLLSAIDSGEVRPVVVVEEELPQYMPETPLITEFEPTAENGEDLIDGLNRLTSTGRAVGAPPGVPEEQLTALRDGLSCAMEDQALLDELGSQQRPVDFMEGEEYAELVEGALNPSEDFRRVVQESF